MPLLERKVEEKFLAYCLSIGVQCKKLKLASEASWPDRTLMYRGRVMFIELKRKGEKPTPLQLYTIDKLERDGFTAGWSDTLEYMISAVTQWRDSVDKEHNDLARVRS